MKRFQRESLFFACALSFLLVGCAKTASESDIQMSTEDVVQEAVQEADQEEVTQEEVWEEVVQEKAVQDESVQEEAVEVDYDLTRMGSDMVYATVYQMMVDPTAYEGKSVRVSGNYYGGWYEPTAQYYFYVIIEDAMACCSQGLEFIWEDGSHVYPDEYPKDGSEVEVTGSFETYQEEGDSTIYCRLKNAEMILLK